MCERLATFWGQLAQCTEQVASDSDYDCRGDHLRAMLSDIGQVLGDEVEQRQAKSSSKDPHMEDSEDEEEEDSDEEHSDEEQEDEVIVRAFLEQQWNHFCTTLKVASSGDDASHYLLLCPFLERYLGSERGIRRVALKLREAVRGERRDHPFVRRLHAGFEDAGLTRILEAKLRYSGTSQHSTKCALIATMDDYLHCTNHPAPQHEGEQPEVSTRVWVWKI
jgi:hypothetical protein